MSALLAVLSRAGFHPRRLFLSDAVKGAIYDYDDFAYLYQKSDGSTPVTALEQPVGLMLDKRYGGNTGADQRSAGAPALLGTATAATFNTSTGAGSVTRVDASNQSYVEFSGLASDGFYRITITLNTASGVLLRSGTYAGTSWATPLGNTTTTAIVRATGGKITIIGNGAVTASFTISSFVSLPGLHAYQSTDAARLVLSARYNLLLRTETFENASWTKSATGVGVAPVVTDNYGIAPDGTQTAARVQFSLGGGTTTTDRSMLAQTITTLAAGYTQRVWVKANGAGEIGKKILHRGPGAGAYQVTTLTGEWQEVTWAETAIASSTACEMWGLRGATGGSSSTADVLVWHPDIRLTADANARLPAYQRVTTETDYDSAGFPRFLRIDATDDFLQTASVDPGTDKVFVCAGVHKAASGGMIVESSTNAIATAGAFYLYSSGTYYEFRSAGTVGATLTTAAGSGTAPNTSVLSAIGNISGDTAELRKNGAAFTPVTTDQGTGNYTAQPIYIGARGGTSLRLNNGRIYPMVICFKAVTAGEIAATEAWVNARTRAY